MEKDKKEKDEIQVKFTAKGNEQKEFERIKKNTMSSNDTQLVRNLFFGADAVLRSASLLKLTSNLGGTVFKQQIDHIKGREEIDFTLLNILGRAIRKDIFLEELESYGITEDELERIKEGTKSLIDREELEELILKKMKSKEKKLEQTSNKKQELDIYKMDIEVSKRYTRGEVQWMHGYITSTLGREVCYRFTPQGSVNYIVPALLYAQSPKALKNGTIPKIRACEEEYHIFFFNPIKDKIESQSIPFTTLLYKIVDVMGVPFTEYGLRLLYKHAVKQTRRTVICTMDVHEGILLNTYYKMGKKSNRLSHLNVLSYDTTELDYIRYGNDFYSVREMVKLLSNNYKMTATLIEGTNSYTAAVVLVAKLIRDNLARLIIRKQVDKHIVNRYKLPQLTYLSLIYGS